jgi:hypothetical protein
MKIKQINKIIFNLKYNIKEFINNYILRKKYCDYCYYFGGLMCDHIDENGNCLGFRRYKIMDKIKYKYTQYKINKIVKKYLTNNL